MNVTTLPLLKNICATSIAIFFLTASCQKISIFEKSVPIPNHSWSSSFKPKITLAIDSMALYNIYVVVRHTDAYAYKNIWLNVYTELPGELPKRNQLELTLATDEKGWMGKGMDDIFEHRILITREPQLLKPGAYSFTLENIMRQDPLDHILNVGIRVEKVNL